ncbi:LytR/AlgR family response regulator transcription factor [Synoicihabitans lomoniglobus]|uniref:LytTR family DNA-binding domain-containing protein n=1 Tax=Synoicihabitans lomoniglobus TaxID=2909285 RepID=A0AAF0CLW3_9BACT|nr:LytTR family DNA-binding domain-containing protein [Opitutaceae bacterium LMO-M01]WED63303.1 LytTR family DNA-binding domain-containing protein [Opitutaceae bacterium LMO-M01]
MWRTLLIDDESAARAELHWLLEDHPEFKVVGEAATFAQARTRLGTADYDVVLLDIQLVGGVGFDLVPFVRPGARVIFITAFDQHALRAFEVNALDYLLKPVSAARFADALTRLGSPPDSSSDAAASSPANLDDRILLKLDSSTERFVRLADISSISASQNYTEVILASGEKLFVRRTMKSWEEQLPDHAFGRVHRTVIVALAQIDRIVRQSRVSFEIYLRGQADPLPVSYRLVNDLRARIGERWPES